MPRSHLKFGGLAERAVGHRRVTEGRGLRKHWVRTFHRMLKLLRELFGTERPLPAFAVADGARTEQAAALVHVSQTAATMGRCR
ncbi:hypothetical protein BH10ACT1_BH10ACT1_24750 [soil metagenome]